MNLIFLLEEPSMKELLSVLTPNIVPADWKVLYVVHNGKSELKKSLSAKLRAWNTPDTKFVVLIDKDSSDCHTLKSEIKALSNEANRPDTLIRIVCTELESWFLGDLTAVGQVYRVGNMYKQDGKKYREPDRLANAKAELRLIAPTYQPIAGARAIAPHMCASRNRSHSFRVFISGLQKIVEDTDT